ncbi:ATP-grasp domain-containing protein [Shouchella sp. 1P09AA]|uniref:ATP-grasp domain-containing protein n=1 Tax=unclassified Shouchella TaxID=2893065 RepID=UPI0039A1192D
MRYLLLVGGWDELVSKVSKMKIPFVLIQKKELVTQYQIDNAYAIEIVDNFEDHSLIVDVAKQLHQTYNFIGALSFTEFALESTAYIVKELDIKGNRLTPTILTRDKQKMRDKLNACKFENNKYAIVNSLEEAYKSSENVGFPLIMKPIKAGGSAGVIKIDDTKSLKNAWGKLKELNYDSYILEEYFSGIEFSIETISFNKKHYLVAITEKITTGAPNFIELGHNLPADISFTLKERIREFVFNFLDVIEQDLGPAHTEIKVFNGEFKIIESQTRVGGDRIWKMIELSTGIDMFRETINSIYNDKLDLIFTKESYSFIRFFSLENVILENVTGIDRANSLKNIIDIKITKEKGERIGGLNSSNSRSGYIIATSTDYQEGLSSVKEGFNQIYFETKPIQIQ